jgi:hypothetical protein
MAVPTNPHAIAIAATMPLTRRNSTKLMISPGTLHNSSTMCAAKPSRNKVSCAMTLCSVAAGSPATINALRT